MGAGWQWKRAGQWKKTGIGAPAKNFPFDRRGKIPRVCAVNLLLNGILLRPLLLGLASR